jgi:hypothetical protein
MPEVAWRGGPEYEANPRRSLIDSGPATRLLGFEPAAAWTSFIEGRQHSPLPPPLYALGKRARWKIDGTLRRLMPQT